MDESLDPEDDAILDTSTPNPTFSVSSTSKGKRALAPPGLAPSTSEPPASEPARAVTLTPAAQAVSNLASIKLPSTSELYAKRFTGQPESKKAKLTSALELTQKAKVVISPTPPPPRAGSQP